MLCVVTGVVCALREPQDGRTVGARERDVVLTGENEWK